LPLPKVYRGPSTSGEENAEDDIDSCAPTTLTNDRDIDLESNTIISSEKPACDVANETLTDSRADRDCVETLPSVQLGCVLAVGSDVGDSMIKKGSITTDNHGGEGVGDSVLQIDGVAAGHISKRETCDTVADNENDISASQLSGDADSGHAVCERFRETDDDKNKLPAALENPISASSDFPGSNADGVVNGSDCTHLPRQLGSISEDVNKSTPLMSDVIPTGGSTNFPSYYNLRRKSIPRFTPSGSFIIPADEDIYVDYSCGLFSTEECYTGGVLDVSTLPSPPERQFMIGDSDETEFVYFSPNESIATALTQSCQTFRPRKISVDSDRHHSDSDISKTALVSSTDVKVEMVDATSREVLDEIFRRTSGRFDFLVDHIH